MDKSYEKRVIIVFIASFVLLAASFFLIPRQAPEEQDTETAVVEEIETKPDTKPADTLVSEVKENVRFVSRGREEIFEISYEDLISLHINSKGAVIEKLYIDGEWNQFTNAIEVSSANEKVKNSDFYFGDFSAKDAIADRPVYNVTEHTGNSITLSADFNIKNTPVRVIRTFTVQSNYQFEETVTLRNLSSIPVNISLNNKSFTIGQSFQFFTPEQAHPRNRFESKYFDGEKLKDAISRGGIFRKKVDNEVVGKPDWLSVADSYFIAIINPQTDTFSGRYSVLEEENSYLEVEVSLENSPVVLDGNSEESFSLEYYVGPRKESFIRDIDPSYRRLFSWPVVFNWFMKPIEWGLTWLMFALSTFIGNWGLVILVLALIIKLVLSPLSIKGAISIKRMNLLQPKMKQLQEKYKDNPQVMQQKLGELYKKEGVNPLGGCWPMFLQIPVFFALFRVLSHSVELKGARFLWIQDLTLPDTLFRMNIPILPNEFNLLPILMTGIQLVQTKLQSTRNPTMQAGGMGKWQTYLLPIMFLFLFWNMPSGLVLYWTIQNVYTIIEQSIINQDKYIKLK